MANIQNVTLNITQGQNSTNRNVQIDFEITFNDIEIDNNVQFRETVALMGDDGILGAERIAVIGGVQRITAQAGTVARSRNGTVSVNQLNEDGDLDFGLFTIPSRDEIFAQVLVRPLGQRDTEDSNMIRRAFR